jgi:hypothetical protein
VALYVFLSGTSLPLGPCLHEPSSPVTWDCPILERLCPELLWGLGAELPGTGCGPGLVLSPWPLGLWENLTLSRLVPLPRLASLQVICLGGLLHSCPRDGRSSCQCLWNCGRPWGVRLRGPLCVEGPAPRPPAFPLTGLSWWAAVGSSPSPGRINFTKTRAGRARAALTRSGGRPCPG